MQKKTETLITGIRSARSRLKKLLAITKDTQMMKSREASWETYGKLQQGIDLLTQAIIISEGEDGLKVLLEQQEAKPRKRKWNRLRFWLLPRNNYLVQSCFFRAGFFYMQSVQELILGSSNEIA